MAEFKLGRLKFVWKGAWASAATFVKDDIVSFGAKTYVCVQGHVADTDFYTDLTDNSYWEIMSDGVNFTGPWTYNTEYKHGDVATYGGNAYIVKVDLSVKDTPPPTDTAKWQIFSEGLNDRGVFEYPETIITQYAPGSLVTDDGTEFIAKQYAESQTPSNSNYWGTYAVWNNSTAYVVGQIVVIEGAGDSMVAYLALQAGTNKNPETQTEYWKSLGLVIDKGTYEVPNTSYRYYKINDIVAYGGNTYVCSGDTSTETPNNSSFWTLFSHGVSFVGDWTDGTLYKVNELVKFGNSIYSAKVQHTSNDEVNDPVSDVSHTTWAVFVDGEPSTAITTRGDMIYRDVSGAQRLPIGILDQVLVVNSDGDPEWSSTANISASTFAATGDIGTDANIVAVDGNFSGNVIIDDAGIGTPGLYIGETAIEEIDGGSGTSNLTNAVAVMIKDVNGFVQLALKNRVSGALASTDLIAYTDDGDNDSGWIDLGITSSSFDITSGFGITGIHDGYIFMNAPVSSSGTGNLVIATGENGSERDIVFVTGGFDPTTNTDAEKVRIIGEGRDGATFTGAISGTTLTASSVTGTIVYDGTGTITGTNVLAGTIILEQLSGTAGGVGTYRVSQTQTVSSTAITQLDKTPGLEVYINTESYNEHTGALRVNGGIGLVGNLNTLGDVISYGGAFYQGRDGGVTAKQLIEDDALYAGYIGLTGVTGVFTGDEDAFVQFALKNHSSGTAASTDIIAYSSNGDNNSGWIDMGITSENFDDPNFTVTGPNTGYVFMSAPNSGIVTATTGSHTSSSTTINVEDTTDFPSAGTCVIAGGGQFTYSGKTPTSFTGCTRGVNNSIAGSISAGTRIYKASAASYSGDLLIGTGTGGNHNDIVLFSGGFDAGNERIRIIGTTRTGHAAGVEILAATESTSTTSGALRVNGGMGLIGNLYVGGDTHVTGNTYVTGNTNTTGNSTTTGDIAVTGNSTVTGNSAVNGNMTIVGTITVGGSGSSLSTTTLTVSDPMIILGKGNIGDIVDLGVVGQTSTANTVISAGLLSSSNTTVTVTSTTGFTTTGTIRIEDEEITYTGKTGTTFTGCTRGVNGTTGATHADATVVYQAAYHGVLRDATDDVFKFFQDLVGNKPTTTVDFSTAGLTYGNVQVGKLFANDVTDASSSTAAGVILDGGLAVAKKGNFGGLLTADGVTSSAVITANATTTAISSSGDIDIATGKKIKINGSAGTDNKFLQTTSSGMQWADAAVTVTDITTAGTYYPLFTTATSGTVTTASVTSNATTIFSFNPSTGVLSGGRKLTLSGSSSGTVSFQAASVAGSTTYTLPSADGTNGHALVTNGSGTLSWAAAGATISDDTSTTTLYPAMSTSTSGSLTAAKISSTKMTFNASTGVLTTSGGYVESSSIAYKENVNPIGNALDAIMQLVGVTYDRKDGSRKGEVGLIAEEVDKVIPNLVDKSETGSADGIFYSKLTAYLVEAIKTLKSEIDPLKEEIKRLKLKGE